MLQSNSSPTAPPRGAAAEERSEAKGSLRPSLYVALLAAIMFGTFFYDLRTTGIFACSAAGYSDDTYLAYCNSTGYGDYDHGAFWFDLEPEARRAAESAAVLFLGTSRMEFAFSASSTEDWFKARRIGFYLLGFSHSENVTFTGPLLASMVPKSRAYVINVDRFFETERTAPAAEILHGEGVQTRYERKRVWQTVHKAVCGSFEFVCGDSLQFVRARPNGEWTFRGTAELPASGVGDGPEGNKQQWPERAARARAFIDTLAVERGCVFLTVVPWSTTPRAEAAAIAAAVGLELLAPQLPDLRTFDGSHLDRPSAERWSKAFFDLVGPRLESCATGARAEPRETRTPADAAYPAASL